MKSFSFKSNTQKVLNLVVNSLYSNKDVFLRELISNSSDAIDKLRLENLRNPSDRVSSSFKIKISIDKQKKALTISDNGIGMTEEELVNNLGTIAESGTRYYKDMLEKEETGSSSKSLVGQFGVGFYSSFVVAKKVEVHSLKHGADNASVWISEGIGEYEVGPSDKKTAGTDIILYIKDSLQEEYLQEYKLREIIRKYSDYIEFPIVMDVEKPQWDKDKDGKPINKGNKIEEEVLNSQKSLWMRPKKDIKEDEYNEFYKYLSHDFNNPLSSIHYHVEGATEFTALIYIPLTRPYQTMFKDQIKNNIHLYVNRVFIMKESDLVLPSYLRFISGVVDCPDLPLNISREILQEEALLKKISSSLISRILNKLKDIKQEDLKKYNEFYQNFGSFLKEGVLNDLENKDHLLDLLVYSTSALKDDEQVIDLKTYVERMHKDQKEIYYICGESIKEIESSAYLEYFKNKEFEVLYSSDPIDEFVFQNLKTYKEKPIKAITKGDLDFLDKKEKEDFEKEFKTLLAFVKDHLNNRVKDVRISNRLMTTPLWLVVEENAMGQYVEKFMKAYNKDFNDYSKRIVEINPNHVLIKKANSLFEKDPKDPKVKDLVDLLYDQALIAEGSKVENPQKYISYISELLLKSFK